VSLVLNTLEPIIDLTPDSIMQQQGVPILYDFASSTAIPSLYICHAKNVLGRVPMIPLSSPATQSDHPPQLLRQAASARWQNG